MSSLVGALLEQRRIITTVQKAKSARSLAEGLVTVAKKGTLAARRQAISVLHRSSLVRILFDQVVPACGDRVGGYTRIVKLQRRRSDGADMAILEWISLPRPEKKPRQKPKAEEKEEKNG